MNVKSELSFNEFYGQTNLTKSIYDIEHKKPMSSNVQFRSNVHR